MTKREGMVCQSVLLALSAAMIVFSLSAASEHPGAREYLSRHPGIETCLGETL